MQCHYHTILAVYLPRHTFPVPLHHKVSVRSLHSDPPFAGCIQISRFLFFKPPHVALQELHTSHWPSTQSTIGYKSSHIIPKIFNTS